MKVYMNKIAGIDDAILSMYFSSGKWTREIDKEIRNLCIMVTNEKGKLVDIQDFEDELKSFAEPYLEKYNDRLGKLLKIGRKHITLLRFIDFTVTVDGLHRAAQDDFDSHAKRLENRIIRMSTRRKFEPEISDWYKDKILTFGEVAEITGLPMLIKKDRKRYVRMGTGYVRDDVAEMPDVTRGLCPMATKSSFIFKCNLTEWAHIYKERRKEGGAHPELKEMVEMVCDLLEEAQPMFTRELLMEIQN